MNKQKSLLGFYLSALDAITGLADILITLSQTVIVSFGVPIALVFLVVVEHHGIYQGVLRLELASDMASFAAWAAVIVNIAVEFLIVHTETKRRHKVTDPNQFSFRLTWRSIAYVLGVGRSWKPRKLSPAQRFINWQSFVTATILIMTVVGRLGTKIDETVGAWNEGLVSIGTQSSLADVSTWIIGLVFSFLAVRGAQVLSNYIAVQVVDIRRRMVSKRQQLQRQQGRATTSVPMKAVMAGERELAPIKVRVGDEWKRKCPQCGTVMSRQAWAKHPCRFTEGVAPVVGEVDTIDSMVDEVDTGLQQPERQLVATSVNGQGNHVSHNVNGHGKQQ